MQYLLLFFSFLFLLPATYAQSPLPARIESLREELRIPGMSIAVWQNGKRLLHQGWGLADRAENQAVSDSTRFRLASVSKLLTTAAIAKLHQDGKLAVSDSVEKYLPNYPHAGRGVTIQRLCGHLGGIRHYRGGDFRNNTRHFASTQEALPIFIADELVHEPGTEYLYSTFAYTLLQAVIEAASGQDFLSYLENEICAPLGMKHTVPDQVDSSYAHTSQLYRINGKGKVRNTPHDDPSYKWGGGGMLSTVSDLAAFGEAHLQGDFFSEATRQLLFTPQVAMPGFDENTEIGLSWRLGKDPAGRTIYHHAGSMNGARSFLLLSPEENLVVAILCNANDLPFIHHLAFTVKDALTAPAPQTNLEPPVAPQEYFLQGTEEHTALQGTLRWAPQFPFAYAELQLADWKRSVPLALGGFATASGMQMRNLQVRSEVIYTEWTLDQDGSPRSLLLIYREKGENRKATFTIQSP